MVRKLLLLLSSALFVCCETDIYTEHKCHDAAVRFSGGYPAGTKASYNDKGEDLDLLWQAGDRVGIYAVGGNPGNNYEYRAELEGKSSSCGLKAAYEYSVLKYSSEPQTFYAYFPFDRNSGDDPSSVPVNLPSYQGQTRSGDLSHLSSLLFLKAVPVCSGTEEDAEKDVALEFHCPNSVVNFIIKTDSEIAIPVKKVRLVSKTADLSYPSAFIDLTSDILPGYESLPLDIVEGAREVTVGFDEYPELKAGSDCSVWMAVAAGKHDKGDLALELTAIDNSVCTAELPSVQLKSNRNYIYELSVNIGDFVQPNPFEINAGPLEINAGESIHFDISGGSDALEFWSGEKYHDYAYSEKDRIENAGVFMTFKHAMLSGNQPDNITVRYSNDFSGIMTENEILKANWKDVTNRFALSKEIGSGSNPNSKEDYGKYSDCGNINVTDCIPEGESAYFAIFYHADKYVASLDNGRTSSWITGWKITGKYEGETQEELWSMEQRTDEKQSFSLIEGASYEGERIHCGVYPSDDAPTRWHFRFFSTYKLSSDRDAYAVADCPVERPVRNLGPDSPVVLQEKGGVTPAVWDYRFDTPGKYEVVFAVTCQTLSGPVKKLIRFSITVK